MDEYVIYRYNKDLHQEKKEDERYSFQFGKDISFDGELKKKKLLFWLVSRGKYEICYVNDSMNELVHYSFIIPYCPKFSFMKKDDVFVGPCWTNEKYRGQGVYGSALDHIARTILKYNPEATLYGMVREQNVASTKGMKKSSYIPVGKCTKTKYLKHYKKAEWF